MISRSFFQRDLPLLPSLPLPLPLPPPPLPPFSLVRVGRKRRRWRLITTQSPLPVRPTPTRSEKGSNRLLPPRGIHYRLYRYSKTNNLHPRLRGKKGLSLSTIHPLLRLFSPNHRRADRSLDYWHPGNPSREWRRFHFENRSTDTPIQPTY